jgi:hypothetical protein
MCLIIDKPAGLTLPLDVLEDMVSYNGDGFGMMWHNKTLKIFKKHTSNPNELYRTLKDLHNFRVLVHLRMRTHGAIDVANTHPYPVEGGGWLMHNGVLYNSHTLSKEGMSDTHHYIQDMINPLMKLHPAIISTKPFIELVEGDIGEGNKFVHMDKAGVVTYFNQKAFVPLVSADNSIYFPDVKVSNKYAWSYKAPYTYYDDAWAKSPKGLNTSTWTSKYADAYSVEQDERFEYPPLIPLEASYPLLFGDRGDWSSDIKGLADEAETAMLEHNYYVEIMIKGAWVEADTSSLLSLYNQSPDDFFQVLDEVVNDLSDESFE